MTCSHYKKYNIEAKSHIRDQRTKYSPRITTPRLQVREEFFKIVNFDEFEEATRKDVSHVCEMIQKHKVELAKDLIECCDRDKDGMLKYDEFVTCANPDFIQRLTRREMTTKDSNSHYSELWNKKSKLLVERFCDMCKSIPLPPPQRSNVREDDLQRNHTHRRQKKIKNEICQPGCIATCMIS